jgi:hypothetical protein
VTAAARSFLTPAARAEKALLDAGLGAALRALESSGGWRRFVISAGPADPGARARAPAGPVKVLSGSEAGSEVLAADFPCFLDAIEVPPAGGPAGLLDAGPDPVAPWAAAIVESAREWAGAAGRAEREPPPLDAQALVERLRALEWDASMNDGIATVSLPASRSFHRARFLPDAGRGVLIEAELAAVDDAGESWSAAAGEVARAANEGLRLARVEVRRGAGRASISAQVHLGCLPLDGPWLPVALGAVETAVSLLGREVRALVDPAVAGLVVSSPRVISRTASASGGRKEL